LISGAAGRLNLVADSNSMVVVTVIIRKPLETSTHNDDLMWIKKMVIG
jgi:hypothetical protein